MISRDEEDDDAEVFSGVVSSRNRSTTLAASRSAACIPFFPRSRAHGFFSCVTHLYDVDAPGCLFSEGSDRSPSANFQFFLF